MVTFFAFAGVGITEVVARRRRSRWRSPNLRRKCWTLILWKAHIRSSKVSLRLWSLKLGKSFLEKIFEQGILVFFLALVRVIYFLFLWCVNGLNLKRLSKLLTFYVTVTCIYIIASFSFVIDETTERDPHRRSFSELPPQNACTTSGRQLTSFCKFTFWASKPQSHSLLYVCGFFISLEEQEAKLLDSVTAVKMAHFNAEIL